MSKKRKKKKQLIDPNEVLKGDVNVTSYELIRLIHRVNPTKGGFGTKEESERYKIKTRLQSLLIRKFYDGLLVEQPDPENPQMVSLKLQYFDEDACHTLVTELDPDARSWVQRQIDEAESRGGTETGEPPTAALHQQSSGSRFAAGKEEYSQTELIDLGRQALEEYDYDTCEDYFHRAFIMSRGAIDASLTILEFYVDHLGAYEKATALADSLSASVKKDEDVKILLALAAVRLGNIEQALDFLGRMMHPRASEVYLLGARYFITDGNTDRAKELLAVLKSVEPNRLQPEIIQLEKDIQQLHHKSLEPMEQEMSSAWQRGELEKAVKLAEQLLVQWPQNKNARRTCNEFAQQQRTDRLNLLLRRADEADAKAEFIEEAELLKRAMELNKDDDGLNKRFKRVQQQAKLQQDEAEIAETIKFWTIGRKKEALLHCVALSENQRREVINRGDLHFSWLSRVISTQSSIKPEKMVEAVLVLGESKERLQKGEEPGPVVSALQLHGKVLRSIPAARDLLQRAQEMAKALESATAKELLKKAGNLVATEDFQSAHECIDQIKIDRLNQNDRKILADITGELKRLEPIQAMKKKYTGEAARSNHFTSRDIALKLADLVEPDTASFWRQKAAYHSAQIKKEWSLLTGNIEDLPPCYNSGALVRATGESNTCLLPDGRHILAVSGHDRWVFLRTFCIEQQKFKQGAMLRAPAAMPLPGICQAGNEIWITSEKGHAISLTLEPLEILSWHDFSDFVKDDNIVENVCVFPKSGYMWLNTSEIGIRGEEICEVINIEQRRVERRFKMKGLPIVINTGDGFRIAVQDYVSKSIHMFSEQGKTIGTVSLATRGPVNVASLHPNGSDYVFLPFKDPGTPGFQEIDPGDRYEEGYEEEDDDFLLTIEKAPDVDGTYKPVIIDDSHGELVHSVYTGLDDGLIFVYFCDEISEERHHYLAVFTPGQHGFEKLYQVESPGELILAADELSRKVVAINSGNGGTQAVVLGRDKPVFWDNTVEPGFKLFLPSFNGLMACYAPTGAMNATKLAFTAQIRTCSPSQLEDLLVRIKQPDEDGPDKIAAFIHALEHSLYFDLARDMKTWFQKNYPAHPMTLIELTSGAVEERKWRKVVSLLEEISLNGLDDGTACHICHLLGMGLFARGDIEGALAAWEQGAAYERGHCDLDPYITYAGIALMTPKERKKRIAENDMLRTLNFFETVDAHLSNKQWLEAVSLMEKYNVPSSYELQVLARFAEAFLHQLVVPGELRWFCKVVALANYCEKHRNKSMNNTQVFPPHIDVWSGQRLNDTASRAAQWLDLQSGPTENGKNVPLKNQYSF